MALVHGEDYLGFVFDGGIWKPYVCGRSITLTTNTELLNTSVEGSGNGTTYKAGQTGGNGSADGLVSLEVANSLTLPELRSLQLSGVRLLFRLQRTDQQGHVYTDEFFAYITTVQDTGSFDNVTTFNFQFTIDGAITQVFTPTPITLIKKMNRYEYIGTGGEDSFTADGTGGFPDLRNKDIQIVTKDGIGNARLVTSGTPVGKEVKYVASSGFFQFGVPFEPGEIAVTNYQDI